MSKHFSYMIKHRLTRKKGDTAQLAAQLAPLEEQHVAELPRVESGPGSTNAGANQQSGAIVVGKEDLRLSKDIMEGGAGRGFLGMEPVVLVILGVMLAFIVFIAWQISQMPAE